MSDETSASSENGDSDGVDYFKPSGFDEIKHYLIMATADYAVWLDSDGELDWETKLKLDERLTAKVGIEKMNAVYNRAAILQAYPVDHIAAAQRKNFRIMVGEGLARSFDFDPKSAMQMFDKASEFVLARSQEIARVWYLKAAGLATIFFVFIFLLGWLLRERGRVLLGDTAFNTGLGCCAGALGAFLSILMRVGRVPLDPSAGPLLHYFEGSGRILIGVLSAIVAQLALKFGLILTIFSDKGFGGMLFVSFMAGFVESFAHTLIKSVEMQRSPSEDVTKV